ncbi:hypothetical protein A7D21_30490 [Pseudomonas sp. AP19]|uniref:hypothetical protein n=1 Tax=Pseudomonas TaxID=286 RepID=UPI00084A6C41|nr:hypothetical protein [Pseudomonas sp. AP19]OEC70117.1 hypothetical protein A7D21_30490 [Pseudomonas sp. AP19]
MSNAMTAEQLLKFAARIYKQIIAPLEKALTRAKACGFPEDHIHRLEHMIEEAKTIAGFEVVTLPIKKKKPGRPAKGTPTVQDVCRRFFNEHCPKFVPLVPIEVQEKKGVDAYGKVKPQEGLTFNFSK